MFLGSEFFPIFAELTVKSSVIFAAALALGHFWTKRPASQRSMVWRAALFGVMLLPMVSLGLPRWQLGWIESKKSAPVMNLSSITQTNHNGAIEHHGLETKKATMANSPQTGSQPGWWSKMAMPSWQEVLLAVWLVVALWILLKILTAQFIARSSIAASEVLQKGPLIQLKTELAQKMGLTIPIRLATCNQVSSPMTWGWRRPWIILPEEARDWGSERTKLVLLHELAHIQRGDFASHLIAQLVGAIYWFNPLCHMTVSRLMRDREHACDDAVLLHGLAATTYADHLLAIARTANQCPTPLGAVNMAHHTQLEGRLMFILDSTRKRLANPGNIAPLFKLLSLLLLFPLAAMAPGAKAEPPPNQPPVPKTLSATLSAAPATPEEPGSRPRSAELSKLSDEQIIAAKQAGLFDRFSNHDVAYLMRKEISLDVLEAYQKAGLWDRFSAHDLGFLISKGIHVETLLGFQESGLIDRFSAHDLAFLVDKQTSQEFLNAMETAGLENRYSAHDQAFLHQKGVPIEFLSQLNEVGLVRRYSAHDAAYLYQKDVPLSYLKELEESQLSQRFSAHDAAYMANHKVPLTFLDDISNAGLIQRYSAHDLTYLFREETSLEFLTDLAESSLADRYSAHDAAFLHKKEVPIGFLTDLDGGDLVQRFSAHDAAYLSSRKVTLEYLTDLKDNGYIRRFSAHDAAHLFAQQIPMDHLQNFESEGLLKPLSAYSLAYLYHHPVPFAYLHQLKDAALLRYFSGFEIHYLHQRGTTMDEIKQAKRAGKLNTYRDEERIRRIFP